jgi:AcrR family transcriptional regulator
VKRKATAQARKPRADSARNRQLLIDAAKEGFAGVGLNVSLEEIARRVGIGTLYRHFPSREAVVEAVYRREVEQLAEAITGAITTLVKRAIAGGEVRKDVDPSDLLRAMVGVSYGNPDAGLEASARRVIDILMDGLRRKDR